MLSPNEFSLGTLADAKPLALMVTSSSSNETFLIGGDGEQRNAVFLDGEHRFSSFECSTATNWRGMLILGVSLEVDEKSLIDQNRSDIPLGALIREAGVLGILASVQHSHGFKHNSQVRLIDGLPSHGGDQQLAFAKWQVVIGTGIDKRPLRTIDVTKKAHAA